MYRKSGFLFFKPAGIDQGDKLQTSAKESVGKQDEKLLTISGLNELKGEERRESRGRGLDCWVKDAFYFL